MGAQAAVLREWPWRRRLALFAAITLWVLSIVLVTRFQGTIGLESSPDEYSIVRWELRHFVNKWLYVAGTIGATRDEDAATTQVARFLELTERIDAESLALSDAARRDQPVDQARLDALHAMQEERNGLENAVETTIERRVAEVMRREGITHLGLVWPPVDFEFTTPPRALVTSYRDRIELRSSDLLSEDLDLEAIERIEAKTEASDDNTSALTFPTAGIGAYPTMVTYTDSYQRLLDVVAHEWMHNYLSFSPLGYNYYSSPQLRSMNETVASIVGREVAQELMDTWPLAGPTEPPEPSTPSPAPPRRRQSDAVELLRELRGEVDTLLAEGRIDEAEALMEQRRRELAEQGFYYRKINQAFYAFTNLYAGSSGNAVATNPIGPKLDELRQRSDSLGDFVRRVRGMNSPEDIDAALAAAP